RRAVAQSDHQTAAGQVALEVRHTFPADAAGDVLRRVRNTVARELFGPGVRHWSEALVDPVNLVFQVEVVIAEQDDVVPSQVAGTDVIVADVVVWNFPLVQAVANPPDRLRVAPRVPYGDPRQRRGMPCDIRQAAHALKVQRE